MADNIVARGSGASPATTPGKPAKQIAKTPQAFTSGPHIPGMDDPTPDQSLPSRKDLEAKAGIESLDSLNAEIIQLAADYGDILHLFRGGGTCADAARKRHRAVISKQIEAFREEQGMGKLSDANREVHANASPEHIAFCAKLDLDGCQYELVRAQKEALEARRESRLAELRAWTAEARFATNGG